MRITTRLEDDILKVFSNNAYVGYVDDKDDLYCFYQGVPIFISKEVGPFNVAKLVEGWLGRQCT